MRPGGADDAARRPVEAGLIDADAYRLLFEYADKMVCTLDLYGRFTSVNGAGERLTGYSADELIGTYAVMLIAPERRDEAVRQFERRLAESSDTPDETVLLTRDGRQVPIDVASTLLVRDGHPEGVLGLVRDLSAQKSAATALHRSEERFRALLESAPDSVVITDRDGCIVLVNAQTEQLFGYAREELVGRQVDILLPDAVRAAHAKHRSAYVADPCVRQMGAGLDLQGRRLDGSTFPVDVSLSPLHTDEGVLVLASVRDVTERKRAEEALLQSEQRFRSAFEFASIGMALVAPEGRFLQVNDSLCTLVGYTAEELLARTFQDITHPEDLEADLEFVRQVLAGELRTYQLEKRYFHRDGRVVWVLLSVSLVRASDGSPLHFISQIQDITERKRAQQEVERSERRLHEAQQIAHVGSWESDAASALITWSDELYRIFGLDPEHGETTYATFLDAIHPDDRPLIEATVEGARATREPFVFEHRIVLPDGGIRWLHGRGEVKTRDGAVTGMRGTAQDITERKEAEQRLAEAEERYRTLVEQLPLGMYIRPLDLSKPNIYCSPQVEPMLGYPAEEWETNPDLLATIVHPDDRDTVLGAASRVRETGEPLRDEYRYIARDGHVVWVQDETYVVEDVTGRPAYVQGFLLDITERKQAEAERDRLQAELLHAQKLDAIGRLAGGVAHDFNNMLTGIKGYAELLLEQLEPDSPLRADAEQIRRAAEQASTLPRQLLAFGRKQLLEPTVVDLNAVVADASDLLRRLISEAVELHTDPAGDAVLALVDSGQVEQVLINLALNARDAMPAGGTLRISTGTVELSADAAAEHDVAEGPYVVVTVEDTGQGMDAETRARAFEPFFTTKPAGRGSGLGLASVFGVVTQSGGFIRVDSEPGRGSAFHVHFPGLREGALPAAQQPGGRESPAVTATILLAEDERIVRELALHVLERAGFTVHVATDGTHALALYEREQATIDVVVTDMVMPGLGGGELAGRILERHPGTPIVYLSGYTEVAPAVDASGSQIFVQKPFSPQALVRAVTKAVERSKRGGKRRRAA